LEFGQQFEQEHSECVGDYLFDILEVRSTVVELEVSRGGGNRFGGVKVKVRTDTAKSAYVMVTVRQCRDLIGEREMLIKYEAKIASRLSSVY